MSRPIWLQSVGLRLLRQGGPFKRLLEQLERNEWCQAEDLNRDAKARFEAVVRAAVRDVPYYRERYGSLSASDELNPASFTYLTKDDVWDAGHRMLSSRASRFLFWAGTGGTTGSPLMVARDLHAINYEHAFIWGRQLKWAGYTPGARLASLRGHVIVPSSRKAPPYWRFNRAENMLMMSSYHLSEQRVHLYLEELERFSPVIIHTYPSPITVLARWLLAHGRTYAGNGLRGVLTASETLPEDARRDIEAAFGCRVFDWYGQGERVAAIGTCPRGGQHLLSDYSFVELIPSAGGRSELVGTSGGNSAMPLIRYRTGDFVEMAPAADRCACGRAFPLVRRIDGREGDAIRLPDGRHIGRMDQIFKKVPGILEAQIRQERRDEVQILLVPAHDFTAATVDHVIRNARVRLGDDIGIKVHRVAQIERTKRGKFRAVVCEL